MSTNGIGGAELDGANDLQRIAYSQVTAANAMADMAISLRDVKKDVGWIKREKQGLNIPQLGLLAAILITLIVIAFRLPTQPNAPSAATTHVSAR